MSAEPQPFIRLEPAPLAGEASIIFGWREGDGAEQVVFRLPLTSALRGLVDELKLGLMLTPSGIITLDPQALPERDLEGLLRDKSLPQATFTGLVKTLLREITEAPDPSDAEDLGRLAGEFEEAARALRKAMTASTIAK
jgi:hypothetical protein